MSDWDNSRFVVLPVPFDATTSFQSGTRKGPKAVIEASAYIELYDDELCMESADAGVHTLDQLDVTLNPEEVINKIESVITEIVDAGKIPVTIGGEHSITFGVVKALNAKYNNLSVLQLDAHADLREEYQGTKWSHACVMRRISELGVNITQAGIRSLSKNRLNKFFFKGLIPYLEENAFLCRNFVYLCLCVIFICKFFLFLPE